MLDIGILIKPKSLTHTFLFLITCFLISCSESENKKDFLFQDLSPEQTGISFTNHLQDTPDLNILTYLYYYNGAGVAVADFTNDGWEDLYLVANQGPNKLYVNKEKMQFHDATSKVIEDNEGWSTGVSIVDINQDGWPDIYLCKVDNGEQLKGKNKLFVHQGLDDQGLPVFEEQAAVYGLDFSGFATQASFFDYDLDGDLDVYLLNHSVHPNRTYGRGSKRKQVDSLSGDRLFQNENGKFIDVSQQAGIYQGAIGYGLGLATSDINGDGYPDIYVGNDFFENDYLYINQKDGTFKDMIITKSTGIGHTSHFTMGVDISDINNDGLPDILSLDMLPENLQTLKASGNEYGYTIYNQYLRNGYQPQFMQNTLQLNRGDLSFSEIGFLSGIAATEWSWAPLFMDMNNDGNKDIFISNGIKGATNDMDFISFIADKNIQKQINKGMTSRDLDFIRQLPEKKVSNYFYRNNGDISFTDMKNNWFQENPGYSNGAAYADLDNDGDVDLVVNNVNNQLSIYENKTNNRILDHHFIQVNLKGYDGNVNAIGAKVKLYQKGRAQLSEIYRTRGYLSSSTKRVHFGLGNTTKIDSLEIIWPDQKVQVLQEIEIDTLHTIEYQENLSKGKSEETKEEKTHFDVSLPFKHQDYISKDFSSQPLIPYGMANEGPHLSVLDFNNDGKDDIFSPGGRLNSGSLWIQNKTGGFLKSEQPYLEKFKKFEDIDQVFLDIDGDADLDMIAIYGGNETLKEYQGKPTVFLNENGILIPQTTSFEESTTNASVIAYSDIDKDGDDDIFIGSQSVSGLYGAAPKNALFKNDGKGIYSKENNSGLETIGQVYDAHFTDINGDTWPDLILAGHYMPITIFLNDKKGNLQKQNTPNLSKYKGWWNCLKVHDMDNDGDLDIIAGNWGHNTRLKASLEEPVQLYRFDFDNNGSIDPIVTFYYQGTETPIATKDELVSQIPSLNKKYLSYNAFAKAEFQDYFDASAFKKAEVKKVTTLATTYFENKGNLDFSATILPWQAQVSSVHAIHLSDLNQDGFKDIILGGNSYDISTQLGRLDGSFGVVLYNNKNNTFTASKKQKLKVKGAVRSINEIKIDTEKYVLFGINNDSIQIRKISEINE